MGTVQASLLLNQCVQMQLDNARLGGRRRPSISIAWATHDLERWPGLPCIAGTEDQGAIAPGERDGLLLPGEGAAIAV